MFFLLQYKYGAGPAVQVEALEQPGIPDSPKPNTLYLHKGKQHLVTLSVPGGKLLFLGDPLFPKTRQMPNLTLPENGKIDLDVLFREIKGHYCWFYLHPEGFCCGTSFGAIYPVYYHNEGGQTSICSAAFTLAELTQARPHNKRNLLERILFNYPFFNSTWWHDIQLLDAHRYLRLGASGARVAGDFEISNYFGSPEDHSTKSLSRLTGLFDTELRRFFPEEPFGISFTGGFDGRTLVAGAINADRQFFTYSFGRPDSTDVSMPAAQAARIGINYEPILLDQAYVGNESLRSAHAFMRLTEYNGNFGRPHYHYAAQALASKTNYIFTGNFGSELFRALHIPGVMMSEALIRIFAAADDSWKDFLRQKTRSVNPGFFDEELESLLADISKYLEKMKDWEPNHRFYYFVFNEIFRKYFGPELVMQSHYLNNRTPFLNLQFFQELNRTKWSGVHARLFEKVKSKRMKGQMFYATFIRNANAGMYHLKTNKGYSPADVLEKTRLPLLFSRVLLHKYIRNKEIDDNSVHAFFGQYRPALAEHLHVESVSPFMHGFLHPAGPERAGEAGLDQYIKMFSIAAGWDAAGKAELVSLIR